MTPANELPGLRVPPICKSGAKENPLIYQGAKCKKLDSCFCRNDEGNPAIVMAGLNETPRTRPGG